MFLITLIAFGRRWVDNSRFLLGFIDRFELYGDISARGGRLWHLEALAAVVEALRNHADVIVQGQLLVTS